MAKTFLKPVENIVQEGRVYVDEQLENMKLRTVKGLSQGTSAITALLLIFAFVSILLLMLSFAFVLWLGELMDSYAQAAFIVAGVLLLILVVCILLRKQLFKNSFVGLYAGILNPKKKENTLAGLDNAIETSQEYIQEQEKRLQGSLSSAKDFYSPTHLLNEGLRQSGLRSSEKGFKLGRFLTASCRALLTGKKKK